MDVRGEVVGLLAGFGSGDPWVVARVLDGVSGLERDELVAVLVGVCGVANGLLELVAGWSGEDVQVLLQRFALDGLEG